MKKIISAVGFSIIGLLISLGLIQNAAYAHCPLCTAAVGAGVAVTRFYGVDDAIVGLFIGGFAISSALWFNRLLKKKYIPYQEIVISLLSVGLTIAGFYIGGLTSNIYQTIFGVDRLLFGVLAGGLITYIGLYLNHAVKKLNSDKILFPFQSIAFILILLSFTSILFFLVL